MNLFSDEISHNPQISFPEQSGSKYLYHPSNAGHWQSQKAS
jgi:hypothetical protein